MTPARPSTLKAAALLLIGGWVTFWAGAVTPWAARFFLRPLPTREYLQVIDENRSEWLWIAACFAAGVLLTLAGMVVLAVALREAGDRVWSELGRAAFSCGTVLWLAAIAFRATATVTAARETVASGAVPEWFEPLRAWAGALFAIYMVLAYLAIGAYGQAMLATRVAPRWVALTHVFFGLAGAAGFVARVPAFLPPLMIHLVPGILGVTLLVMLARQAVRGP